MTVQSPPQPQHQLTQQGQKIDDVWFRWLFALVVALNTLQDQYTALDARVTTLEGP